MVKKFLLVGLFFVSTLLWGLGASPVAQAAPHSAALLIPAQTVDVAFGGLLGTVYAPNIIRIAPGDTVRWQGDFSFHPLVSNDSLWVQVSSGTQFEYTFNTPGTYSFHCFFHGAFGMTGTVQVAYRAFLPDIIK